MSWQFLCRFCEFLKLDSNNRFVCYESIEGMRSHSEIHAKKNDCSLEHMMERCFGIIQPKKPPTSNSPEDNLVKAALTILENSQPESKKLGAKKQNENFAVPKASPSAKKKKPNRKRKSEDSSNLDQSNTSLTASQSGSDRLDQSKPFQESDQSRANSKSSSSDSDQSGERFESSEPMDSMEDTPSPFRKPTVPEDSFSSIFERQHDTNNVQTNKDSADFDVVQSEAENSRTSSSLDNLPPQKDEKDTSTRTIKEEEPEIYWDYITSLENRLNGITKFCKKIVCQYECCGKEVTGRRDLLDVHVLHHAKLDIYHCVFCALCFNNRSAAYAHIGKEHVSSRFVFSDNMVDLHTEYEESLLACLKICFPLNGSDALSFNEAVVEADNKKRVSSVSDLPSDFRNEYKRWRELFYQDGRKEVNCKYSKCEWKRRGSFSRFAMEEHVAAHAGVNLSGCLMCGAKLRNTNGILHFQNLHPGVSPTHYLQDLRPHFKEKLMETAVACFKS